MSFLHKYFLEQNLLEIHDIRKKRGAAVDLSETFVIWHAPDPSQLLHFLLASRKDPVIFGKRSKDLAGHYCPVLVERTQGRPLGKHLAHLCGDRLPYKNGMIIQSFGAQNLNPCSGCIRRFTSTYKLASDGTPIYMQTPFDSCVSLPGTVGSDAVCGNCEWHGTRQECEYGSDRRVVGPPETMGDLARICSWQGKYATKPALDVLRCGIPERNWITRRNIPGGAFEYGGKLSPAPIVPKA
ncbi:hypothetical protein QBC39DRAFT_366427 [Podospora conica]|nr:hypothetical protein QBC39DRAFT_366427 [Schizothecium conicum]